MRTYSAVLATLLSIVVTTGVRAADAPASGVTSAGPRPNLVLFLSDDHSYLDTSIAGDEQAPTPNLARIAAAGMSLTHVFAASPSCAPSRAALLTGLMPNRNGAMLNHQPPQTGVRTLPRCLHELGYEVVAFGKVAHYKQGERYGFDRVEHDTFHDDACIDAALAYLDDRNDERPLCLCVGTNWPHVPWPAVDPESAVTGPLPPTHVDTPRTRHWRARYYAAIGKYDADLGRVFDAAYDKLGDDTLFLHFSDHGGQWPFGKWNLYDAGTRVPCVAVWPAVVKAGSRSDAFVNFVDVLPTLLDAAGGTTPDDLDGRSFLGVLTGKTDQHRDAIFTTHSSDGKMNDSPMRAIRTRDWKYIRNLAPDRTYTTHIDKGKDVDGSGYWASWVRRAMTDPRAAAIVERYRHRTAEELYDLRSDPHEQHSLIDDPQHAEIVDKLRKRLDEWMASQNDRGLPTEREAKRRFREHQAENEKK